MDCLLNVVIFYVGYNPDITRIFTQWVTRKLSGLWAFEMFLARIFLWYPNGVKVEEVVVALCKPHDGFMTPGKPSRAVQAVLEMPNDAVTHL